MVTVAEFDKSSKELFRKLSDRRRCDKPEPEGEDARCKYESCSCLVKDGVRVSGKSQAAHWEAHWRS